MQDAEWMIAALALAEEAQAVGEVPVGAVLVADGQIIGRGSNRPIMASDPTAHAEILALQAAATARQNYRLPDATLYVTLEPCTMCFGAMVHARIKRLVFAALEPKAGAVVSHPVTAAVSFNHTISVTHGVLAAHAGSLLSDFFTSRREASRHEASRREAN